MKKQLLTLPEDRAFLDFLRGLGSVVLGLKRCSAELDRTLYQELTGKRRNHARRSLSGEYKLERVTETYFDVSASVALAVRDRRDDKVALSLDCTFEGHFHGVPPIDRKYAERFTKSQLRVVLWPYFRQFVSDTTARMTIAPIFLPIYLGGPGETTDEKTKPKGAGDNRSNRLIERQVSDRAAVGQGSESR